MKKPLGISSYIGVGIGVFGLTFGYLQYRDKQAEERAAQRVNLIRLEDLVKAHQGLLYEYRQMIDDTRLRLRDVEAASRYVHGEFKVNH